MADNKYLIHDHYYQYYRSSGAPGWGEQARFDTWKKTVQEFAFKDFVPKTCSLLELGCGAGNVSLMLTQAGYQVTGIDISPTAIDWARERLAHSSFNAEFICGDVVQLESLTPHPFDFILDGNCLHCIIGQDRKKTIQAIYTLLNKGGVFYLSTHCDEPQSEWLSEKGSWFDSTSHTIYRNNKPYRYVGKLHDVLSEFENIGFQLIHRTHAQRKNYKHLKAFFRKP